MSRFRQEELLLNSLSRVLAADDRGFSAQSDWPSGVLILARGRYRGIWRWKDAAFAFTPGGYGASTYAASSPEEAVRYTLDHVCRQ